MVRPFRVRSELWGRLTALEPPFDFEHVVIAFRHPIGATLGRVHH